jgi:hypothetical protein
MKKGYIFIPWFDVYLEDVFDPHKGCNADHWGRFKSFIFNVFFALFWNGTVYINREDLIP